MILGLFDLNFESDFDFFEIWIIMSTETISYWCYRCSRIVRLGRQETVACPDCESGFLEEVDQPSRSRSLSRRRRFPAAAMYMIGQRSGSGSDHNHNFRQPSLRSTRRNGGDRSPFNPVIVLRGGGGSMEVTEGGNDNNGVVGVGGGESRGFELFYDDGAGSGLRPLPPSMSEFLLGSGFDRLLEQLSQIEINGISRYEHPPATKSAIDSLPTIEIDNTHLEMESHCAVCKEAFELTTIVREMPCKHIYHPECILPWLALHNSCPVCRHELPSDSDAGTNVHPQSQAQSPPQTQTHSQAQSLPQTQTHSQLPGLNEEESNVGLTIWRLPGGGFAVGRFSGGRRGSERELPVVYTEMDGGFNNGGEPRRISWSSIGSRGRERGGGLRRFFGSFFGCFGSGVVNRSAVLSRETRSLRNNSSHSSTMDPSPRSRRTWSMDVNSGMRSW
ncbi:hypothetical protein KIW84_053603 [Lathyrus oleraceus]|uniref:RING-type E3 ubiquitin transferase n=1 Tax=Pisum sativum TaxID=3888 RepID=A0A9D5AGZ5_PEA|nr:hypothetical protein KIW84_053603 [Pisum sativum]